MSLLDVILVRLAEMLDPCSDLAGNRRRHGLANPDRPAARFELALAHETGKLAAP